MPNQKYFDIIPPGRYPTEEAGETDIPKKLKEKLPSEQIPKKVLEFKRRFQIPRFPIKKSFLFLFFILIFFFIFLGYFVLFFVQEGWNFHLARDRISKLENSVYRICRY